MDRSIFRQFDSISQSDSDVRQSGQQTDRSAPIRGLPGINLRPGFRFRKGQYDFLKKLAQAFDRGERNHLGVFVPGYGKTITALSAFVVARAMGVARKLVVFVPRGNLRDQYADRKELQELFTNLGAGGYSYSIADSEKAFLKNLDTDIIITTYQYASGRSGAGALRQFCESASCMFVFDEVHHLAEDGTWASVIETFRSTCSVALSGTPIRSDNKTLFGVPMEEGGDGEQFYTALHEVTLRDAHAEGRILKKVEAHVVDYHLTMMREDTGERVDMTLSQLAEIAAEKRDIDAYLARRKLRFHEVYLESLLDPAFRRFREKRDTLEQSLDRIDRNHQMLVIAMSNRHAAAMLEFIRRRYPEYSATRIGQDVPTRERRGRLEEYRNGRLDVMVQVDMIGEGTDIKPISLIVKADLVRAWSKTLQQIFRGMRYFPGFPEAENVCDIYSADDSQVMATLRWVTSEFRAGVKIREQEEENENRKAGGESFRSLWDLTNVAHRESQSHTLDLFGAPVGPDDEQRLPPAAAGEVVDIRAKEEKLRRDCAALAAQLAFVLEGRGESIDPRRIHAEAMKRFAKSQDRLNLRELEQKRKWLERCLAMRKLV